MKGTDNLIFWIIILVSFFCGYFIFDDSFNRYSDLTIFLSIMIVFKITSLSILFNSPLKKLLYDRKIKKYGTELHRLKSFYQHSLYFEVFSVFLLFTVPKIIYTVLIFNQNIIIGRYLLVLPVLTGVMYCFFKVYKDLLVAFVYPTNY